MSQITLQVIITKHYFKHDVNLVIIIDFFKTKNYSTLTKEKFEKEKGRNFKKKKKKDAC